MAILARARNRSGDKKYCVEISRKNCVEFFQSENWKCSAIAERQHSRQRRLVWPFFRGCARRQRCLGIRKSALWRAATSAAGGANESSFSCLPLHGGRNRKGAVSDLAYCLRGGTSKGNARAFHFR